MPMPQVNVTLPAALHRLLVKVAAETGTSISGLAADCIEIGLDEKIEKANKRAVFLTMEEKRQHQKVVDED
jgi:hypothetical protein